MTRVLIVDDSAIIRSMLIKILGKNSSISVVGQAGNGLTAIEMAKELKPNLIIMDISLPLIDGLEATKQIMQESPCAIVLFTSEEFVTEALQALEYGAIDIILKPDLAFITSSFDKEFLDKINAISSANTSSPSLDFLARQVALGISVIKMDTKLNKNGFPNYEVLGIAASTGGPLAIQKLLQDLGAFFPLPILIVQHIEEKFDIHFVSWLSKTSPLPVSMAENNQKIEKGHVYIAPADYHMVVEKGRTKGEYLISLNQESEQHFLRPAADLLFFSLADVYEDRCISIVLTGMGSDGAEGSLKLKEKNSYTIAESKESCVVFGMPKAAIDKGAIRDTLALPLISEKVLSLVGSL